MQNSFAWAFAIDLMNICNIDRLSDFARAHSRLPVPFGRPDDDAHRLRTRDAMAVHLRACVVRKIAAVRHNSFMKGIRKKRYAGR